MAVNCWVWPVGTEALDGLTLTVTLERIATEAESEAGAPGGLEVAVTVTVDGEGRIDGAVYSPSGVIVPTVALPPIIPFTSQVTDLPPDAQAVNCCVAPMETVALVGLTLTCVAIATEAAMQSAAKDDSKMRENFIAKIPLLAGLREMGAW